MDVLKPLQHKRLIEKELEGFGIRLNKDPPNINYKRKEKGGINLQTLVPQSELDLDLVKTILSEYRIHNADITLRYDATADDLIDVVEGNRSYIPCIYILNKMGMQKRQFFYASNYHLLVCKDGKLRRKMILENNLLKFYGLGCQKCIGSLILYGW